MSKITVITGGVSSGKSDLAERLVLEESIKKTTNPVYIATSIVYDEEMKEKVILHIEKRRDKNWTTIDCPFNLDKILDNYEDGVILIDCITMFLSNMIFVDRNKFNLGKIEFYDEDYIGENIDVIKGEILCVIEGMVSNIRKNNLSVYFVTNEIGLGGISENKITRIFTKLCGEVNQILAQYADSVYFSISGLPLRVK